MARGRGAASIVAILLFVPDTHQDFNYVFTERINNSGYSDGSVTSGHLLLRGHPVRLPARRSTQSAGFDACAHLSEETKGASMGAAKGIWQSILYSAIGGYILLLGRRVRGAEPAGRQPGQLRSVPAEW